MLTQRYDNESNSQPTNLSSVLLLVVYANAKIR